MSLMTMMRPYYGLCQVNQKVKHSRDVLICQLAVKTQRLSITHHDKQREMYNLAQQEYHV